MGIIAMSPWGFIGFESISNSSADLKFKHKHVFKILLASAIANALVYLFMCVIAASPFLQRWGF